MKCFVFFFAFKKKSVCEILKLLFLILVFKGSKSVIACITESGGAFFFRRYQDLRDLRGKSWGYFGTARVEYPSDLKNILQKLDFFTMIFCPQSYLKSLYYKLRSLFQILQHFFSLRVFYFFFLVNYIYNHSASFRFHRSLDDKMNFSGRWAFI